MGKPQADFNKVVRVLEKHYGRPKPPQVTDPLKMILLENTAYLVDDERRAASYRSAQEAIREQLPEDYDTLVRARQLLRQHGQELCRRSRPLCDACPLRTQCRYFQGSRS